MCAFTLLAPRWSKHLLLEPRQRYQDISVADAHRGDGKRFVVRADEILTAFVELEAAIRESGLRNESERPVGLRFGGCKWQTIPPSL